MEMLGLIVDNKLSFEKHIAKLCQTASHKLHALRRIRKYLTLEKARVTGNVFVDYRFSVSNLDVLQKNYLFQNAENSP